MEYHHSRFSDHSLMIYKNETLVALLPANSESQKVYSHQGLSYGGLVLAKDCKFKDALNAFAEALRFLNDNGFVTLHLKPVPKIYHHIPSDEVDYVMFKTEAHLERRDVASVIDLRNPLEMNSSNRKRNLKKAKAHQIRVEEVTEFDTFFNQVLIPNLREQHQTLPTHSVEEISLLKSKFPRHIRQFNAYYDNEIVAGVTIFETDIVAHAQYISTLSDKKEYAGLDAIFSELITSIYKDKHYFSFGISNEDQGKHINEGLIKWKESFGSRAITHDFYEIKTENYSMLKSVLI